MQLEGTVRSAEAHGLRTPFWGTLSGIRATVGGSLSQNALFWGSGQYGTAIDSLLSLEVVLGDGTLVHTGSAAQINSTPFFRHFGPISPDCSAAIRDPSASSHCDTAPHA
jgi:FAD/FMN-containing dehydrogenase